MANTRANNVIAVDTSALFDEELDIKSIKYIAGETNPSASIKADSSTGTTVWETADTGERVDEVCIRLRKAYVTVASGTKVYLYLK